MQKDFSLTSTISSSYPIATPAQKNTKSDSAGGGCNLQRPKRPDKCTYSAQIACLTTYIDGKRAVV